MRVELIPVEGLPEIARGIDLAILLSDAIRASGARLIDDDILVVAHKIVSKSEGAVVDAAQKSDVIRAESSEILRDGRVIIARHKLGFVCANAGVDESNTGADARFIVLPKNPDESAARLKRELDAEFQSSIGVVITDSFGRPWRMGIVNVAIGLAGIPAVIDVRGQGDSEGRTLTASVLAVADEIAAAAGLLMGKLERVPAVIVRGMKFTAAPGTARDLIRPKEEDFFS